MRKEKEEFLWRFETFKKGRMELNEVMKQMLARHGQDVLTDSRLLSFLLDIQAFLKRVVCHAVPPDLQIVENTTSYSV